MLRRWSALTKGTRWAIGVVVALIGALVLAYALLVPAAALLAHFNVGSAKGSELQTARDAAQGRLLTLGAGLFAAGALIFTARNYTLSREGQLTDRYTKAIEQLGSDNLDVRTGGIYSLERVARDSAKDRPNVMEVLAAFVREQSRERWPPVDGQSGADVPLRTTRPDVQAAVAVIGRRDPKYDRQVVNFNSANLTGADLSGADLAHAKIDGADVAGAQLNGANLTGAQLNGANLTGAQLNGANLTGAQLNGANLAGAKVNGANLTGARMSRADLTSADLTSARLAAAWLSDVDFTHADLDSANLADANLAGATLTDANLSFADLTWTNLTSANLTRADLSRAYLTGAVWPPDAAVPPGWRRDPDHGRLAGIGIPSVPGSFARLPDWVREYLFPTERIASAKRAHPIALIAPAMWILAGTLAAGLVTATLPGSAVLVAIVWALAAVLYTWQGWKIASWLREYFVITDRRMMLVSGLLTRRVDLMPLAKVTDMSLHRSTLGRALGYADLIVESAGQEQALSLVRFVPYPEQIYQELVALMFPSTAGRDESDPAS